MSTTPHPDAMIEVRTSFFVLAFLLHFFKPQVAVDGAPGVSVAWGPAPIPVRPGRHQVEVWLPYLFFPKMGHTTTVVDVAPGASMVVAWHAPWLAFLGGKVTVSGPFPLPAAAPAPPTAASWPPSAAAAPAAPAPPASAAPAAPAPAAGAWHPDPAGRHEQRYHDGDAWTEHVANAGVQSTDPVDGPA